MISIKDKYKNSVRTRLWKNGARGAADRGVESLRFQVSIVRIIAVSNPTQAGQRFTWSKTGCDRQQLWKAVITGDTVTRLSIPIRGHGKSPEEGQRWNLAET